MVSKKESQSFCFALGWISISTKFKVMSASILLADCQHFLGDKLANVVDESHYFQTYLMCVEIIAIHILGVVSIL